MITLSMDEKLPPQNPPPYAVEPEGNADTGYPPPQRSPEMSPASRSGPSTVTSTPYPPQPLSSSQPYASPQAYTSPQPYAPSPGVAPPQGVMSEAQIGTMYQQQLFARCARGDHDVTRKYGACGIITAVILFPIGLICLLSADPDAYPFWVSAGADARHTKRRWAGRFVFDISQLIHHDQLIICDGPPHPSSSPIISIHGPVPISGQRKAFLMSEGAPPPPFPAAELQQALQEQSFGIKSFELSEAPEHEASAHVDLLEGRGVRVSLTSRGYQLHDSSELREHLFETIEDALQAVSPLYVKAKNNVLHEKLVAFAATQVE
ncbi:hypothetical protein NM688_g6425 [Phlebia brevispora]|uniref:Uncharacterized protein n=1 Tax=Phlebia brevispora TaxID=194682 RepID=A0ACC1SG21_9APHY|nr:hypothetical protein NM688_g6425 [Phlebia brevispora]